MREFLRGLELDDETIDTIMAEYGKNVTRYKEAIDDYKDQVSSYQNTINELNSKVEDNSKSLEDLQNLRNENKDLTAQLQMSSHNVKDEFSKFVKSEVLSMVDDDTDFETALSNYKEEHPQYFGETQVIKTKSERNFGIDLLRMIAMEMIVVLHLMGYGIAVFAGVDNVPPSMYVHLFLNILCGCGVNLYAFISGYVASGKKVRFSNLIVLWMRVVFYAVIFVVIAFIFGLKEFDLNTLIKSFFPTLFNYWWYWTAYFALFIFSPLLNIGIDHLNRKSGISLFITLFICI